MKQSIDVLVGCQYGSEAKGLAAKLLTEIKTYDYLVSVNSAQAGHTTPYKDGQVVTRQLPASCVNDHNAKIYIGPGAVINPEVLTNEINMLEDQGIPILDRLYINKFATVIEENDIVAEQTKKLQQRTGSTLEGVGSALSKRAVRESKVVCDHNWLFPIKMVYNTDDIIGNGNILLEGSQGFGLSNFSHHYPKCTSRDTTTAAFLSYAQLSFRNVFDVFGVYRTFPIRVAGNSGHMYNELSWSDIDEISGYSGLSEHTTVTGRLRRISQWDPELARRSSKVNGVTKPLITFLNYIDSNVEGIEIAANLSEKVLTRLRIMAADIGMPIYAASTSKYGDWIIL